MSFLHTLLDLFLHLDVHLQAVISQYGTLTYVFLFLIVFCETGLVVMPFLPGDSLLFAAGAFAAKGSFNLALLFLLLAVAAIGGDAVNYAAGAYIGPKLFMDKLHLLKRKHLDQAHAFYERYGGKAIIFARFVPIVRTLAPFVAGMGRMTYAHFAMFNIVGGLAWIALFLGGGYLFGNIPFIAKNFEFVILGIIVISVLPAVWEWVRARRVRV